MINLSLKELKIITKYRSIKGYESKSKVKLWDILNGPKPIKENKTISNIRKDNDIDDTEYKGLRDTRPKNYYENDDNIEYKGLRNIRFLFELEEEDYYKPVKISNAFSYYMEYEGNGDNDKSLSINEYLDKIRPYLTDMINDLKKQGGWKIQWQMQ